MPNRVKIGSLKATTIGKHCLPQTKQYLNNSKTKKKSGNKKYPFESDDTLMENQK